MMEQAANRGISGIVFDAVGTLIDASTPVAEVYALAAMRQGIGLDSTVVRSRFRQFFGQDEVVNARGPLATDEPTERRRWQNIVANVLNEVPEPDRAFEELWEHFATSAAWRCFDDVGPTLSELKRRGIPIWIASNFDSRLRSVLSGLSELSSLTDSVVISSEVGYRKPHPLFFEAVIDRSNLTAGELVCVGDDVENDVVGAMRAGLRGVWIDREGKGAGENPPRVADLQALLALFDG